VAARFVSSAPNHSIGRNREWRDLIKSDAVTPRPGLDSTLIVFSSFLVHPLSSTFAGAKSQRAAPPNAAMDPNNKITITVCGDGGCGASPTLFNRP
jgi:hypothetical protein